MGATSSFRYSLSVASAFHIRQTSSNTPLNLGRRCRSEFHLMIKIKESTNNQSIIKPNFVNMKSIETRTDIEDLVNKFYDKVIKDEVIGFFFTEIAQIDLKKHLPKMYNFWESILLGNPVYDGNPMRVHFPLNQVVALEEQHFDRWLMLWQETLEQNFSGQNAETALLRAQNIARIMSYKMKMARS